MFRCFRRFSDQIPQGGMGGLEMIFRSGCCCILLGSLLGVPALGQTSTTSNEQPAASATQPAQASGSTTNPQQESTPQSPGTGTQAAATAEDIHERKLLDRIEQLEKRLAELEARGAASTTSVAPAAAAPAPAAAPAAGTPAAQEPAPPTWSVGPIDFSGLVDGYYSFNANHPASQYNQLYNFDSRANQFSLNMVKLSMAHAADPVGFQVDFGFGRAFDIIHASEPNPTEGILRNIEQAYVSVKPSQLKGLEFDLGQFVTSAGAEVIETQSNWNYSRSLLFSWAIPYYHFGLRTSFPVGKHFTGGVQVVNGWNDTEDNNSGKTIGVTGTFTYTRFAWTNTYYGGPENPGTNTGWRHLYDSVLLLTPKGKFNAYLNFDYGQNTTGSGAAAFTAKWYGLAGALHYQATSKWAITPRLEWFADPQGFATGTGVHQTLKEGTITGEYKMVEGLLARLEYRHDWSNQPFFESGSTLITDGGFTPNYFGLPGTAKSEDTVTLGVVAFFGPKR